MLERLINQYKILPTKVFVRKLVKKLKNQFASMNHKANDFQSSTFISAPESFSLNTGIVSINPDSKDYTEIMEIAEKASIHEFNILGSGYTNVKHGMEAEGFETNNYSEPYSNIIVEKWLKKSISVPNKKHSANMLMKLPKEYKGIDWQIDFRSGYRWQGIQWSKEIKYGNVINADIKIPWELGRMQHLTSLAFAIVNVANPQRRELYFNEYQHQILDFTLSNPPRFGTQWMSSMDVSIRLCNWLVSLDLLKSNGVAFSKYFEHHFNDAIYAHYEHIKTNMEWSEGMRGNHYLTNLMGLLCYLAYHKDFNSDIFYEHLELFCDEILYQFFNDGLNFESSLPYHFLSVEILCISLHFINQIVTNNNLNLKSKSIQILNNKITFSVNIQERINSILDTSEIILKNNANIPQFGDNDSGFILNLKTLSFDSLLGLIQVIKETYSTSNSRPQPVTTMQFEDFGLFFTKKENYTFNIRCGKIGQYGKGGHDHNDCLSFTLEVNENQIVVDPGTYVYTSNFKHRNMFRATAYHNTLKLENLEQNDFFVGRKDDLFWLKKSNAKPPKVIHSSSELFIGEFYGYPKLHKRAVMFKENLISGKDLYEDKAKKRFHFHLHPDVKIKKIISDGILLQCNDIFLKFEIEDTAIEIEDYFYSPAYGVIENAKRIVILSEKFETNWAFEILDENTASFR